MEPRRKFAFCISNKLFAIIDGTLLLLVLIFQGSVLNFYIISHSEDDHISPYFWFLGDFLAVFLFTGSLAVAYRYLHEQKRRRREIEEKKNDKKVDEIATYHLGIGVLPLCYVTWICYSSLLVARIAVIFSSEIPNRVNPQDVFGPQLLKFSIATSTIIFILHVAGHHDAERDSQRGTMIKGLCTSTAFELLDSVSFLSILIIRESHLIFPFGFEHVVLAFACMNYFLPSLALYQMSLSDFGQKEKTLAIDGVYRLLHMTLVNIPYLAIRIYLWGGYGSDISIFVMKNIIGILWNLKDIVPDIALLHEQCTAVKRNRISSKERESKETMELATLNS